MECRSKTLVIWWLAGSLLHAPFPVLDADKTAGPVDCWSGPAAFSLSDIDFVLLGCDLPEDSDDGPIDNQPEHGTGPFAASHVAYRAAGSSNRISMSGPSRILTIPCVLPGFEPTCYCRVAPSAKAGAAFPFCQKPDVSRCAVLRC